MYEVVKLPFVAASQLPRGLIFSFVSGKDGRAPHRHMAEVLGRSDRIGLLPHAVFCCRRMILTTDGEELGVVNVFGANILVLAELDGRFLVVEGLDGKLFVLASVQSLEDAIGGQHITSPTKALYVWLLVGGEA